MGKVCLRKEEKPEGNILYFPRTLIDCVLHVDSTTPHLNNILLVISILLQLPGRIKLFGLFIYLISRFRTVLITNWQKIYSLYTINRLVHKIGV